ncbi:MAG TPA: acyl carrier protein [Noviherbaspirillum sp.]
MDDEDILPLKSKDLDGYKDWIVRTMATWLESTPEEIDPDRNFADVALDSVAALRLLGMIEIMMDQPMDPSVFTKYPSPSALAEYLAAETV